MGWGLISDRYAFQCSVLTTERIEFDDELLIQMPHLSRREH